MAEQKDTRFLESFGEILKTKCRQDEPPFCTVACPFHLDIKDLEPKWESGRWNAAYRAFQTAAGFPAIVSKICPRPCEKACILRERGGALSIGALEDAMIRLAKRRSPNAYNLPAKPQRAAVIGGGLSGLGCALRLCNKKYQVTIFERAAVPGGCARGQMDPADFDAEIRNQFQFEKPELRLLTEVVREKVDDAVTEQVLFREVCRSYDVVYVATGAGGEDFGLAPDPSGAFATTSPGVFMGGAMTGADAVTALAQGLRASLALERYLKTGLMNEPADRSDTKLVLDPARIPEVPAIVPADASAGYTGQEAAAEARRCRKCSCDICMQECDLMRIQQKTPGRLYEESYITVRPSTLANDGRWATRRIASCDQCGLCKTVCPQRIDMGEFLLQSHRGLKETDAMPWAFHDYWLRDLDFSRGEASLVLKDGPGGYVLFPGCQVGASDPRYVKDAFGWMRAHFPGAGLWLNCCGAPAVWAVEDDLHAEHLRDLREQWEGMGRPTVVFTCPTCRKMFDRYLPQIPGVFLEELMAECGWPEKAPEKVPEKAPDEAPQSTPESDPEERYAIFDPCASRDYPQLQRAVRTLADRLGIRHEDLSHTGEMARCCSYGGQYAVAAPDYAKRVRMERAEESPLPYITYCVNCRDTFASRGKENLHILDLVFGRQDCRRETPTLTGRWENRRQLRRELIERYGTGDKNTTKAVQCADAANASVKKKEMGESGMTLLVEKELERKLSDQYILISDMEAVVFACESAGSGVIDPATGHITGHKKLGHMTYWAEYEPLSDGTFRLWNGYAHRMNLEGE